MIAHQKQIQLRSHLSAVVVVVVFLVLHGSYVYSSTLPNSYFHGEVLAAEKELSEKETFLIRPQQTVSQSIQKSPELTTHEFKPEQGSPQNVDSLVAERPFYYTFLFRYTLF